MEIPDTEFMARLAEGDDLALNALMDRWSSRITGFLLRMTGREDAAIDLAQETFVKLYRARHRYRPSASFPSYLFAIASNLARNHARWKARHPTVSLDEENSSPGREPVDPARTPEEIAESQEIFQAAEQAFQALPCDLREPLSLFVHERLSYAEISGVIGCSRKAVEKRIYKARLILRKKLAHLRR